MAEMSSETCKLGREVTASVTIDHYDVITPASNAGPLASLKNRVTLVKDGQYIEYTLKVTCEGKTWNIKKRFKEIAELHKLLQDRFPSVPRLPEKTVLRNFAIDKIEQRVQMLKHYYEALSKRRDVMNCPELWKFFHFAEHQTGFQQAAAATPVQTAEVQEANFGIADFAYDLERGILLMGAVDFSSISRLDTMIMNMKLPWEKQAMNLPVAQMSIWRQVSGTLRFNLQSVVRYSTPLTCVCLSGDHGYCFAGLHDGTVGFRKVQEASDGAAHGNVLPLLRHTSPVTALVYGRSEKWLFSASKDGRLSVFDMEKQLVASDEHSPSPIVELYYDAPNRRLYSGTLSGKVGIWDVAVLPPRLQASLPDGLGPEGSMVSSLELDSNAQNLFSASKEGISVYAIRSTASQAWGRKMGSLSTGASAATSVQWAASSKELLVGCENGTVCIFDIEKGQSSFVLQAHDKGVTALMWLDAPRRLLTASKDKTLKIWDFPSLKTTQLEGGLPVAMPSFSDECAPVATPAPDMTAFTADTTPSGGYPAKPAAGFTTSNFKSGPLGSSFGTGNSGNSFRDLSGPLGAFPTPFHEKAKAKSAVQDENATDPLRRPGGSFNASPLTSSAPPEPAPQVAYSTQPETSAQPSQVRQPYLPEPFEPPFSSEAKPTLPGPLSANPLAGGGLQTSAGYSGPVPGGPLGGAGATGIRGGVGSMPLAASAAPPRAKAAPAAPAAEVVEAPKQENKKVNSACLAGDDSDDDLFNWNR